ncbi:MAG: monovalent cation:proton antiporter-2 (CPA2) family protein [Deltaproteobacteria bacterium]|nr:monovalent cation:proton antiporter-2 (CPA2) family protein [Deltaproteobacteria bacterium]
MNSGSLLYQAFVFLAAAVIAVPLAKRLGLGSVLGYLLAGVAIGPFALGLIGDGGGNDVMHFAEFGVVMMLFVIGLELEPVRLWRLRVPVLGVGGLQVVVTAVAVAAVAMLLGLRVQMAAAVGLTIAMSSTAIVMQTLNEKGWTNTTGGQNAFAVLLFQDIAVIPILAFLPLLATVAPATSATHEAGTTWVEHLPGWAHALVVLAAMVGIGGGGRFLIRPAFRIIAKTRLREVFTAAALLLVIGISLLMDQVGLSRALGAFLAGVVLAGSEYRHELESDIEPFKGLLLGLFFIGVGASIDFGLIASQPITIAALVIALIVVKLGVLLLLGRVFAMPVQQNLLFSFALAQGGEFAFVLFSFCTSEGILTKDVAGPLVVAVAVSMALSPLLMVFFERQLMPRFTTRKTSDRQEDTPDAHNPVIIAGYGRFGQIVGRLLSANGIHATVLESDSDQVDLLRRWGHKVFYGDASRLDLLRAAGAGKAKLLVLALDSHEKHKELIETAKKHFPHLHIVGRAKGRIEAYDLLDHGVDDVQRETFEGALRLGITALRRLGFGAHQAERAGGIFRRHDEKMLREFADLRRGHEANTFFSAARERQKVMTKVLESDIEDKNDFNDHGWDVEALRAQPPK